MTDRPQVLEGGLYRWVGNVLIGPDRMIIATATITDEQKQKALRAFNGDTDDQG